MAVGCGGPLWFREFLRLGGEPNLSLKCSQASMNVVETDRLKSRHLAMVALHVHYAAETQSIVYRSTERWGGRIQLKD